MLVCVWLSGHLSRFHVWWDAVPGKLARPAKPAWPRATWLRGREKLFRALSTGQGAGQLETGWRPVCPPPGRGHQPSAGTGKCLPLGQSLGKPCRRVSSPFP